VSRNQATSIRARLKQRADTEKQDFNLALTDYSLERLLYRVSISSHPTNFLLVGALLRTTCRIQATLRRLSFENRLFVCLEPGFHFRCGATDSIDRLL